MFNVIKIIHIAVMLFLVTLAAEENRTSKTVFTVAIDPEYAPFTLRDADGKASGMFVDFWNLWQRRTDIQ